MGVPNISYNTLLSIEAADKAFVDRTILSKLHAVFVNYKEFGVCLVHRHCTLEDEEVMVADGNATQPERIHSNSQPGLVDGQVAVAFHAEGKRIAYPCSWHISGQPFEYTLDVTPPLPSQLLESFKEAVELAGNPKEVLGIYHIAEADVGKCFVEHTEGRKNIVKEVTVETKMPPGLPIQTNWCPSLFVDAYSTPACCTCMGPGHGFSSSITTTTSHAPPIPNDPMLQPATTFVLPILPNGNINNSPRAPLSNGTTSAAHTSDPSVTTESLPPQVSQWPPKEVPPGERKLLPTTLGPNTAKTVTNITVPRGSTLNLPLPKTVTASFNFRVMTTTQEGIEVATTTTTIETEQTPGPTDHITLTTTTTTATTRTCNPKNEASNDDTREVGSTVVEYDWVGGWLDDRVALRRL